MDPMVSSSIANCGAISDSSDNAALLDFCFLCSRQFFHDNLDNYGTERLKDEDILETFFEELGPVDRALLQCCPSCQTLCKTLTRTKEALSSLIDEITNLLLRSKKVSYLLSKSRVVSRLFQSSNISLPPCEVSSSYLQQPLSQLNFTKAISSNSNNSSNCFPTQFNLRLDSSNLSVGDPLDLDSNISSISKKHNNAKFQNRYKTGCSQEISTTCSSSAFSCIYNDSIMNSVCDNACDISEDIKIEQEQSSFETSVLEMQKAASQINLTRGSDDLYILPLLSTPTKPKCKEKSILNFRSNPLKLSQISANVENAANSGLTIELIKVSKGNLNHQIPSQEPAQKIKIPINSDTVLPPSEERTKTMQLLTCNVCKKSFQTERNFKVHLNAHNQEHKFICEMCGMKYRHKKGLDSHVAIHKGESKFRCDLCYKTFSQNIGLKRHLRIHARKFEFVCDTCGKQFLHHTSFTAHKLIHIGVKNFACPECDQTFLQNSNLQRHLKTHTGEKPHRCPRCNRSFTERYNLLAHLKSHENSTKYLHECSECSKTYTRKFKLKQHMKQIHNIIL